MKMEKIIERSPAVKLLEKLCPSCEKNTQHECSSWHPSDLEILRVFNARATIMTCKDCGEASVQTEFLDGLLLR